MKTKSLFAWLIVILATLYFVVPLLATLEYAMRQLATGETPGWFFLGKPHSFDAFVSSVVSPRFQVDFLRSMVLAVGSL